MIEPEASEEQQGNDLPTFWFHIGFLPRFFAFPTALVGKDDGWLSAISIREVSKQSALALCCLKPARCLAAQKALAACAPEPQKCALGSTLTHATPLPNARPRALHAYRARDALHLYSIPSSAARNIEHRHVGHRAGECDQRAAERAGQGIRR